MVTAFLNNIFLCAFVWIRREECYANFWRNISTTMILQFAIIFNIFSFYLWLHPQVMKWFDILLQEKHHWAAFKIVLWTISALIMICVHSFAHIRREELYFNFWRNIVCTFLISSHLERGTHPPQSSTLHNRTLDYQMHWNVCK